MTLELTVSSPAKKIIGIYLKSLIEAQVDPKQCNKDLLKLPGINGHSSLRVLLSGSWRDDRAPLFLKVAAALGEKIETQEDYQRLLHKAEQYFEIHREIITEAEANKKTRILESKKALPYGMKPIKRSLPAMRSQTPETPWHEDYADISAYDSNRIRQYFEALIYNRSDYTIHPLIKKLDSAISADGIDINDQEEAITTGSNAREEKKETYLETLNACGNVEDFTGASATNNWLYKSSAFSEKDILALRILCAELDQPAAGPQLQQRIEAYEAGRRQKLLAMSRALSIDDLIADHITPLVQVSQVLNVSGANNNTRDKLSPQ